MRVLIACEESQAVCTAFRKRGHEAYSADIQHCALYNHIEWHIVEDARLLLNTPVRFQTVDAQWHQVEKWDLIIAHPPCTYLTSAGSVRLFNKDHTIKDPARYAKGLAAKELFLRFLEGAGCEHIAVENPAPMHIFNLPPYTQIIEPYMFGEPWKKRTCLWLRGLPELRPTNQVEPVACWVDAHGGYMSRTKLIDKDHKGQHSAKMRSKTFPGIAEAMAEQWGNI